MSANKCIQGLGQEASRELLNGSASEYDGCVSYPDHNSINNGLAALYKQRRVKDNLSQALTESSFFIDKNGSLPLVDAGSDDVQVLDDGNDSAISGRKRRKKKVSPPAPKRRRAEGDPLQ